MKKIGFIGGYDKTDLIIYVAKLLEESREKVLIIDTTASQRARYTVPCITPSKSYVTTYEGIDIAIGFETFEDVKEYLGDINLEYSIIFIDIDSPNSFSSFEMKNADKNFFVTAFDNYSLKRGMEVFSNLDERIKVEKVFISMDMSEEDNEYVNFISLTYKVDWDENIIYIPYDQNDIKTIMENQKATRIQFKYLTNEYKEALLAIVNAISPEIKAGEITKILKNI